LRLVIFVAALLPSVGPPLVARATLRFFMRPIHQRLAAWSWKATEVNVARMRGAEAADSTQVDFRHELEYGITEKFQGSIYLSRLVLTESDPEHSGFTYSDTAIELIYNLTKPNVLILAGCRSMESLGCGRLD